ncbi:MAG TPA: quercetin 2,3-dioxygenase [Salinimicrobium sp.]|nr:quercetin 2,3-dioxygenase [Salinimicrobium sp.]
MQQNQQILLNPGEGESYWVLGDLYSFKATSKQTNGNYTLIEQAIQPQGGPPPHIHYREDEAFYVLEGKFSFLCGEKQSIFETGSFLNIPRGTLHTFKNLDEKPGRLLVFISPAGLEEFFYAVGTAAVDLTTAPDFNPAVIDKVMQLAEKYHMEVILPDGK